MMERLRAIDEKAQVQRRGALLPNEQRMLMYAQSYIHEVAIHKDFWPNPTEGSSAPVISITRAQLGWDGLSSAKALARYYVELPPEEWFKLDTGPVTQMLYSLIMLNKYVSLDSSDSSPSASNQWDIQLAFKEASVQEIGTQIIEKMATLVYVEKLYDESRPIWWALGWIIKNMVHGHQARICGGLFGLTQPRREDPLVDASQDDGQQHGRPGNDSNIDEATGVETTGPISNGVNPGIDMRPSTTPFAMSFPDVTFDQNQAMMWQEGMYQTSVWDVMLNDMTTLPFG
jgi:hypothetical protein